MMGVSINGNAVCSNQTEVGSNPTPPATPHTVALIRMGEDGKITYGGEPVDIRRLLEILNDRWVRAKL